jgi:hypothetical protein
MTLPLKAKFLNSSNSEKAFFVGRSMGVISSAVARIAGRPIRAAVRRG